MTKPDTPVFFFEIFADGYRYGMGYYAASRGTMDAMRNAIDTNPSAFRRAVAFLKGQDRFVVEGESYVRPMRTGLSQELSSWYQRKNLYLVCSRPIDDCLYDRALVDELSAGFAQLAPFYRWLRKL